MSRLSWVERGTGRAKCLAQEHKTVTCHHSNPAGPLAPKPSPLTNMPQLFQTFVFKALLLFFRNLQIKIPTCARGKKTAKHVREILRSSWLLSHLLIRSCRSDLPLNSPYTAYLRKKTDNSSLESDACSAVVLIGYVVNK